MPARPRLRSAAVAAAAASSLVLALVASPTSVSASTISPSATVASTSAPAAPAAARGDNPTRTKVVKYRRNWTFRSTKLGRCAFVELTARVEGRWRWAYRNPDGRTWNKDTRNWLGFSLKNPTVHVTGWPTLGAGCDSTKRWKAKAEITQGWYTPSCSLDADVSVGYPWSVSVTPQFECGEKKQGHTTSTEGPSRKTLHQYNSGVPLTFEGTLAPTDSGVGFKSRLIVRIFKKNASDRVTYDANVVIR